MKIHALCIVKNEADVLGETLAAAQAWADHIYVFDNGSDDGTWELVQRLAGPQIVPFKQDPCPFSDSLRADIFEAFKDRVQPGDWWARLDSDEFYIDDPRVFLAKVPPEYAHVSSASFSYYFTEKDAAAWEADPEAFHRRPVQERLRYYVNHWSEPRFVRHSAGMAWKRSDGGWPRDMGRPYPVRIWVKHFAYRSPEQITRRLASRRGAIEAGSSFGHEAIKDWATAVSNVKETRAGFAATGVQYADTDWRSRVVQSQHFDYDALDRRLVVNEALMPPLGHAPASIARRAMRRAKRLLKRIAGG